MLAQQFDKVSCYEKWHRKLDHTLNREVHDSTPFVKGLKDHVNKVYQQHTTCSSCMIGKTTLEDFSELKTRADKLLKQVNINSYSSSVILIEGYSHAVVIVDCHSGYRWLYGMKTKDDTFKVIKTWYS